jgi:predicted AAA+ superfamily ATPase
MQQYEEDMAELTRQRLSIYRERLEDSRKRLDTRIHHLESRQSADDDDDIDHEHSLSSAHLSSTHKRSKSFLSTSVENLHHQSMNETIASHPHLLDISFLNASDVNNDCSMSDEQTCRTVVYRPLARYPSLTQLPSVHTNNLRPMMGLSQSQQAIIDETDQLVKDSQQLHTESATQFERARESLLSR